MNPIHDRINSFFILTVQLLMVSFISQSWGVENKVPNQKLFEVCKQGSLEDFKKLEKNQDLNQTDPEGQTLLMVAIQNQQKKIVEYLLSKKVQLNTQNLSRETALSLAISNDQPEVAQQIIQAGAELKGFCGRKDLFICAVSMNDIKAAKLLYSKNKDFLQQRNEKNENVLFEAVRYGTQAMVEWLVGLKQMDLTEKNKDGKTVKELATEMDRTEILTLF